MYEALGARPWLPEVRGWLDGEHPILVLEDLSTASWPPPWDRARVDAVLGTLAALAEVAPPAELPKLADGEAPDDGWHDVLAHPGAFLALGLCSPGWLDDAGPILCDAAAGAPLAGFSVVHGDVRSDNLCLRDDNALLLDWNLASVGNPRIRRRLLAAQPGARERTASRRRHGRLPRRARRLRIGVLRVACRRAPDRPRPTRPGHPAPATPTRAAVGGAGARPRSPALRFRLTGTAPWCEDGRRRCSAPAASPIPRTPIR